MLAIEDWSGLRPRQAEPPGFKPCPAARLTIPRAPGQPPGFKPCPPLPKRSCRHWGQLFAGIGGQLPQRWQRREKAKEKAKAKPKRKRKRNLRYRGRQRRSRRDAHRRWTDLPQRRRRRRRRSCRVETATTKKTELDVCLDPSLVPRIRPRRRRRRRSPS